METKTPKTKPNGKYKTLTICLTAIILALIASITILGNDLLQPKQVSLSGQGGMTISCSNVSFGEGLKTTMLNSTTFYPALRNKTWVNITTHSSQLNPTAFSLNNSKIGNCQVDSNAQIGGSLYLPSIIIARILQNQN